jgi:hypothetical protein
MKLRETKKLHYNKYLYKLSVPNQCASFFRTEFQKDGHLGYARQRLDVLNQHYNQKETSITVPWGSGGRFYDKIPVEHYYDAIDIYRHLKCKPGFTVRVEVNNLNIYSNDRKFLISLSNKLRNHYIEFWEPSPEDIDTLLTNENIIIVNNPPIYEFKITLGKGKGNPSLASWIDANPKLGKMGEIAKGECYKNGWVKGYYFFVRDTKSLLIAQMLVGDNIQRIDKLVYNKE